MSSIDVIVPCYRYAHFLRECVKSVLNQSGPSVRVVVIDDASPDNTAEVAAELASEDSRVHVIRHVANKGHIATYNEGIEWVSAAYLLLLSADDYLLPGALERSVSLMESHPEVGFTFGNAIVLEEGGEGKTTSGFVGKNSYRIFGGPEFIELSASHNIVTTPTAVVRTSLQRRLGGYRSDLPHSGDLEMWLRLAAHASVGKFEACHAVYRRHSSNMSLAYMDRNPLPDLEQRKAALDYFFKTCGGVLEHADALRQKAFWSLGCDAVGLSSSAFNAGSMEVSAQLSEFAVALCPKIKRSQPWLKLACKRRLGLRTWNALRPAVDRILRSASPLG